MKFLKYSILTVAAATALAFSACSDDDYEPAVQSPGAYFPTTLASSVNISPEGPSFTVEIDRTTASSADTYTISSVDESGLFSIPSSVTFSNGSLTAEIVIAYDPSSLVAKQAYPLTLSVEGSSEYGASSYSFNAVMRPDYKEVAFNEATDGVNGYGTYYFNAMNWGEEAYYMTKMYVDDPKIEVDVIHNFMANFFAEDDGFDFEISRNMYELDPATNTVPITVEAQYIGYDTSQYGKIYIIDRGTWMEQLYNTGKYENITAEDVANAKAANYYDATTGTFHLYVSYIIPEYGEGYSVGSGEDQFQFDGFPEGWVNVNYKGFLTTPSESYNAIAEVTAGADCKILRATMVQGADAEVGVNAILAGTAENAQAITSFDSEDATEISFSFEEEGTYTIVVVSFDSNNEAMDYGSATFSVEIGQSDWKTVGTGEFADPWIIPGYGYDNTQMAWYVKIKQSKVDPNLYALVDPYKADSPFADINTNKNERNIIIDLTDDYAFVQPQQIAFTNSAFTGDENYVANYEGLLEAYYPEVTKAQIAAAIEADGDEVSYYDADYGMITINNPYFSFPGVTGVTEFYSWKSSQPGLVLMPQASQAAKRKVKAMSVAAPKNKGYKVTMGVKAMNKYRVGIATNIAKSAKKTPVRIKK